MSDETSRDLTCPKCGGGMRTYERNGITIDQCAECRGVFLDRGELERLIDAESASFAQGEPPGRGVEGGHGTQVPGHRKRRGFLGDLFEMGE